MNMGRKYRIRYGLGGGFGGSGEWEGSHSSTEEDAWNEAWECACEVYESYNGMYGLRTVQDIMEDDGCDEEEAYETWCEEREMWIEYEVEGV